MKLVIQIPCLNEEATLPATLADLPSHIPGFDRVQVLVIDDGSTDGTSAVAETAGVERVVRFTRTGGLGRAFARGLREALTMGADVIVNTDGDNQYRGEDILRLVRPILEQHADLVVGVRDIASVRDFGPVKRPLHHWGSRIVRFLAGSRVSDTTSGFRAYSRRAATQITLRSSFSHTLETLFQAERKGLNVAQVPIRTNRKTRDSRLFRNNFEFIARSMGAFARTVLHFRPIVSWSLVSALIGGLGLASFAVGVPGMIAALGALFGIVLVALAITLDIVTTNQRLLEEAVADARDRRDGSARRPSLSPEIFPLRTDRKPDAEALRGDAAPLRRVAD